MKWKLPQLHLRHIFQHKYPLKLGKIFQECEMEMRPSPPHIPWKRDTDLYSKLLRWIRINIDVELMWRQLSLLFVAIVVIIYSIDEVILLFIIFIVGRWDVLVEVFFSLYLVSRSSVFCLLFWEAFWRVYCGIPTMRLIIHLTVLICSICAGRLMLFFSHIHNNFIWCSLMWSWNHLSWKKIGNSNLWSEYVLLFCTP